VEQASADPAAIGLARQTLAALLMQSPGDLEAALTAAQLAMADKDPQDALRVLDEARVRRPRNEALAATILETLRQLDGGENLEAQLNARLSQDPAVLEWRLAVVDLRLDALDIDGARSLLAAAPADQQEESAWLRRESVARFRDADPEGALAVLDQIARLEAPEAGSERSPLFASEDSDDDLQIRRVSLLLALPDYGAAERAARGALVALAPIDATEPQSSLGSPAGPRAGAGQPTTRTEAAEAKRAHLSALLLRSLLGQERRDDGAAWLSSASASQAGTGELAGLRLAVTAASMGAWDLVLEAVDPWVSKLDDPQRKLGREHALGLAALAWMRQGEPLRGARLLEGQESRELLARRAEALWRGGERKTAVGLIEKLAHADAPGRIAAAETWQRLDRFDDAAAAARAALADSPNSVEARFLLATALERSGRVEPAIGELERLLTEQPTFAPGLNYLAYLLAERGRELDRALRLARAAVAADPGNAAYLDSLAWARFRRGEFAEAARLLERAAKLEPDDGTLWEHLGDARAALADRKGAAAAYRKSLAMVDAKPVSPAAVRRKLRGVQ
jgi:predicted Zn-dependent protease